MHGQTSDSDQPWLGERVGGGGRASLQQDVQLHLILAPVLLSLGLMSDARIIEIVFAFRGGQDAVGAVIGPGCTSQVVAFHSILWVQFRVKDLGCILSDWVVGPARLRTGPWCIAAGEHGGVTPKGVCLLLLFFKFPQISIDHFAWRFPHICLPGKQGQHVLALDLGAPQQDACQDVIAQHQWVL